MGFPSPVRQRPMGAIFAAMWRFRGSVKVHGFFGSRATVRSELAKLVILEIEVEVRVFWGGESDVG